MHRLTPLDTSASSSHNGSTSTITDSISRAIPVLYQSKGWKLEDECCRCSVKLGNDLKGKKRYECKFCKHAVCNDCSPGKAMHPTTRQLERVCSSCEAIQLEGEIKSSFSMNRGKTEELEVKLEKAIMARQQQEVKVMILAKKIDTLQTQKEEAQTKSAKAESDLAQLIRTHQEEEKQLVSALHNIEEAICGSNTDRSIPVITQSIIRKHQETVESLRTHSLDTSERKSSLTQCDFPVENARDERNESGRMDEKAEIRIEDKHVSELTSSPADKEMKFGNLSPPINSTVATLLKAEIEKNSDLTLQLNNMKALTRKLEEQLQSFEPKPRKMNWSAHRSHNSYTYMPREKRLKSPNRSHRVFREDAEEECQHCVQYRAVVNRLTIKVRELQGIRLDKVESPRGGDARALESCQCTLY